MMPRVIATIAMSLMKLSAVSIKIYVCEGRIPSNLVANRRLFILGGGHHAEDVTCSMESAYVHFLRAIFMRKARTNHCLVASANNNALTRAFRNERA